MFMKGPEATWKFLIDRKMNSEFPLFGATYTGNSEVPQATALLGALLLLLINSQLNLTQLNSTEWGVIMIIGKSTPPPHKLLGLFQINDWGKLYVTCMG